MLKRQKTILYALQRAGRPVSKTELTKWCFLLRYETESRGGPSFYQFVPYQYGPFSFCLYREMDTLVKYGYINEHKEGHWIAEDMSTAEADSVQSNVKTDVDFLVERFGNKSLNSLVEYVYSRHPWYTVNSLRKKRKKKPTAALAVYTAGYEGLHVDGFMDMLIRNGIRRIVDVRNNPVSRRYGFHKSTLQRVSASLDLLYTHIPELGIRSDFRRELKTQADYQNLFKQYQSEILAENRDAIQEVCKLVSEEPSVLVCMEADPKFCHRQRLAVKVSKQTGMPVVHLEPETNGASN